MTRAAPASLVNRRIFRELFLIFSVCAGSLLTLLLIGRLLQLRDLLLSQDLTLLDLARLFVYLGPFFLLLIIPISCMLAVFLTYLRMGTDNELTALKASGVSLYQLLPAPLAFALACTLLTGLVSFHGLAWGMNNFRDAVLDFARTKTQLTLQPGVFNTDFPGLTVYARNVDRQKGELSTVMVKDETAQGARATVLAAAGRVVTDEKRGEIIFLLEDGTIYRQEGEGIGVLGFETYRVRLDLSKLVRGYDLDEAKPKEMSWERLNELAADENTAEEEGGNFYRKVLVEKHKRMSLPLACLVLGVFALPLSTAFQGLSRQWGLVLALGFFMLYYTLLSLGLTTGEAGTMDPAVGMWLPNAVFLGAGLLGLRQAAHERWPDVVSRVEHLRLFRRRGREA